MAPLLTHPERVAIARLHAMLELLPAALDRRLAPAGISSFEYTLLEPIAESEAGALRLTALALRTNASISRISRVVTSLERRGLVERAPCADDRRATNAVLTPAGRDAYERSRGLYADAVRELVIAGVEELSGDGVAALAEVSVAILARLDPERRGGNGPAGPAAPPVRPPDGAEAPGCGADPDPDPESTAGADPDRGSGSGPVTDCAADPAPSR